MVIGWLRDDIVDAGHRPLMLCFLAFVVTFIGTRTITRLIRAGRGPFRNVVSASGMHVHHAVPGIILLIVGAFIAVGTAGVGVWFAIAAIMIGVGVSLVLDEFALILHLQDDYWANEGRLSVNVVSLTAAYLGLVLVGLSPLGMDDVGGGELVLRISGIGFFVVHGFSVLICVLKGKYRLALISLPVPFLAMAGAVRLARPGSLWARRRYSPARTEKAARRAQHIDARWEPVLGALGQPRRRPAGRALRLTRDPCRPRTGHERSSDELVQQLERGTRVVDVAEVTLVADDLRAAQLVEHAPSLLGVAAVGVAHRVDEVDVADVRLDPRPVVARLQHRLLVLVGARR